MNADTGSAAPNQPLEDVLDWVVHASLRPTLLFVAPLLSGLGLFHWVLLPPGVAQTMTAVAELSAFACVLLLVQLHRGEVPIAWSHRIAGLVAALVLGNSLAHLYLVKDPADTTNVLLFMAGAGFVLLSTPWLVTCLVVAWAGWTAIAFAQPDASGWWRYIFALISATVPVGRRAHGSPSNRRAARSVATRARSAGQGANHRAVGGQRAAGHHQRRTSDRDWRAPRHPERAGQRAQSAANPARPSSRCGLRQRHRRPLSGGQPGRSPAARVRQGRSIDRPAVGRTAGRRIRPASRRGGWPPDSR